MVESICMHLSEAQSRWCRCWRRSVVNKQTGFAHTFFNLRPRAGTESLINSECILGNWRPDDDGSMDPIDDEQEPQFEIIVL